MLTFLSSSASVVNNTTVVYYVIGIIVIIAGAISGGYRLYNRSKNRWTEEGETRAKQAQAIEENNNQLRDNTIAIGKLTKQLADFIVNVTTEMNGLGRRVDTLEKYYVRHKREENTNDGS